jgi:hypothetical protein
MEIYCSCTRGNFLTFEKKSMDVITVFARHEVLLLVLLKILLVCDVMTC